MQLSSIVNNIVSSNLIAELTERLNRIDTLTLKGSSRIANSLILSAISKNISKPLVIIVSKLEETSKYFPILNSLGWNKILIYPTSESSPYDNFDQTSEITWGQLQVLSELGNINLNNNLCVLATERSLQPHLPPKDEFYNSCIRLISSMEIDLQSLSDQLVELGYKRVNSVDQEGTWARRGDIIDIFPVSNEIPIRCEFFGDILEKIKEFDISTQRSLDTISSICITPIGINQLICNELKKSNFEKIKDINYYNDLCTNLIDDKIPDGITRLLSFAWDKPSSLIDYLPTNSLIVLDEKDQCISHSKTWFNHVEEDYMKISNINNDKNSYIIPKIHKDIISCFNQLKNFAYLELTSLNYKINSSNIHEISNKTLEVTPNQFGNIAQKIKDFIKNNNSVYLISAQPSRTVALLQDHECSSIFISNFNDYESIDNIVNNKTPVAIKCSQEANIEGVYLPTFKIVIFSDKEFYGQTNLINNSYIRRRRRASSKTIDAYKLTPGDYVVHRNHGIGLFKKIEKITISHETRDYLVVKYLDGILRVAADQLSSLSRYRTTSDSKPKVNKLGGAVWEKTKERAKRNLKKVAIDLIKLYAEREANKGYAFPTDGPWQAELEDSFPYLPTTDQLKAVSEVKKDMERQKPMDRLICGDVGYGKTEVAIRAIFKAITSGKQIALLAPTTILSQQHWRTISDRFAPYPIKVSLLNRFKSNLERKNIIADLENGTIDAIIGTHQLLNKQIKFKNLGLLVIDEEQRFGVNQKEKIKALKKSLDVLTLSATPIPRTLYMSLSGVREMSLITTPPPSRRPIKTNLCAIDDEVIRSAISQEIDRGGQIFYVVPRVEGIEDVANKIKVMLPQIKLLIAHGQMSEGELEASMVAFNSGEADLMLCTTIIESGLDIPRVNTIIIEDSHKFGLSQLYQLRGRVGRSGIQAYAWLFYPNNSALSIKARERLRAIQEFSSLGSGYQLSMRDIEIRGVGNLLGIEQSGQMEIIGFDLYMELLKESLAEIQGQNIPKVEETQIDLPITAFIPGDYIVDNNEKINAYKKASQCNTNKDIIELASMWTDRYGLLPKSVETLLALIKIKIKAKNCGITRIKLNKPNIILETYMDEPAFRLLRQGLAKHLHGRLIYKKMEINSNIVARGIGLLSNEKQIEELTNWLENMENQLVNIESNSLNT